MFQEKMYGSNPPVTDIKVIVPVYTYFILMNLHQIIIFYNWEKLQVIFKSATEQ